MSEKSMTLLTQIEIDTLLSFINEKNDELSSRVLTQESVDKLIDLLSGAMAAQSERAQLNISIENEELLCKINEETKYLELSAKNPDTGEVAIITPMCFESGCIVKDDSQWGYCISPINFYKVAAMFKLKYNDETMQVICKQFAKVNYGDENYNIPEVFLPNSIILEK